MFGQVVIDAVAVFLLTSFFWLIKLHISYSIYRYASLAWPQIVWNVYSDHVNKSSFWQLDVGGALRSSSLAESNFWRQILHSNKLNQLLFSASKQPRGFGVLGFWA